MKFAQKISSSRRSIWNACSACSPASASTCSASGASSALAGWTVSPQASSSVVSGGCASQWTSSPGTARRSSRAIATSRQAWPSPIGEESSSARRGRSEERTQLLRRGARGPTRSAKSWISRFTSTGWRAMGMWPAPSSRTCSAPVSSARASPRSSGWQLSRSPCTISTGQRTRRQSASTSSLRGGDRLAVVHRQVRRRPVEPVGHGVLDLLGRVRLREHLAEEELEEPAVVGEDRVPVLPLPAVRGFADLVEGRPGLGAPRMRRASAAARPGRSRRSRARDRDAPPAIWTEGQTPSLQIPPSTAACVAVASMTARQSCAYQPSSHCPEGSGWSEFPLPRPS